MAECELCRVVRGFGDAELERRYGLGFARTTRVSRDVVAMPSLGSLGSLHALVLPVPHLRSTAAAPQELRRALWRTAGSIRAALAESECGTVVLEHGLAPGGGEGCGVEHAHIHVVGVPTDQTLHPPAGAWEMHECEPEVLPVNPRHEHLVIGLPSGPWLVRHEDHVESQLLRRWLAQELKRDRWDWRVAGREDDLPGQARSIRELLGLGTALAV